MRHVSPPIVPLCVAASFELGASGEDRLPTQACRAFASVRLSCRRRKDEPLQRQAANKRTPPTNSAHLRRLSSGSHPDVAYAPLPALAFVRATVTAHRYAGRLSRPPT